MRRLSVQSSIMAEVVLRNVKKLYPNTASDTKKLKKGKSIERPVDEEGPSLQITAEGVVAVQEFNLNIAHEEFIVLVGPSGCGKSTTLRMIAGLEEITEGEIEIDGRVVNNVPPKDRDIAMVFQNYALYPHMNVYDNMAFSLNLKKVDRATIDKKVREAAEILDLTQYLERKPKALSGGQRQRVAIGRAIVREPKVFLMDEPLSNLDAKLRNQMRTELIKLRQKLKTTFVYVTHDQTEAMTLGDRIVIMKDGFIQQIGTPQEVFNTPSNLFVAGFIGTPQMNFTDCELKEQNGRYLLSIGGKLLDLPDAKQAALRKSEAKPGIVVLGIRPDHVELCGASTEPSFEAELEVKEMMGSTINLHMVAAFDKFVLSMQTDELPREGLKHGDKLCFKFDSEHLHIFDKETKFALT